MPKTVNVKHKAKKKTAAVGGHVLALGLDRERNGITALPAGARDVVLVDLDYLLRETNPVLAQARDLQRQRDAEREAAARAAAS